MQIIAKIMASTASALLPIFFYISHNCHFWGFFYSNGDLECCLFTLVTVISFYSLFTHTPPVDLGVSLFRFILVYDVGKIPF